MVWSGWGDPASFRGTALLPVPPAPGLLKRGAGIGFSTVITIGISFAAHSLASPGRTRIGTTTTIAVAGFGNSVLTVGSGSIPAILTRITED